MADQSSGTETTDLAPPESLEEFRDLEETCVRQRKWEALAELYREYAETVGDGDVASVDQRLESLAEELDDDSEVARVQMLLGDLYADELGDEQAAKEAYRMGFASDTSNTACLRRARDLYRQEENFELVLKLYELEAQAAGEDREKADVLVRMAHVHGDRLGDRERALELVREALDLVPEHPVAETTEDLYEEGSTTDQEIDESIDLAEEAVEAGESQFAAESFVAASRLEIERDGGTPRRGQVLARRAIEEDPSNEVARELYERVSGESAENVVRDEAVADGGAVASQVDEGGDAAEVDGEAAGETVDEPADQAEAGADEESDEVAEDEEESEREAAGETGRETDEQASDDADGEGIDEDSVEEIQPAGREPESIYETVESFDGDYEEALDAWEEEHRDLSAFAVVREDLREEERYEELAEKLDATLKYMRKEEGEAELMAELARIYWKELADYEQAEHYFKRLKLLDNSHPDVGAFYEEYYADNEQWRRLFSHLKSQLEDVDAPGERLRLVERRARVAENEMESPEKAIDVWKNYLRDTDDHEARLELQRLYEENEKWNGLVDFLKAEVERLEEQGGETADRRADLLMRMVDLYEDEIGHKVMALNTLQQLVDLQPDNVGAFERLRDMLEESRRWNDLVELFADRAEWHADRGAEDRAVDLYLEAADVLEDELKHTSRAVDYLEDAVDVAPERNDVRRRLVSVYESKRDYESLYELRKQELELYDGHERLQRLYDMLELVREKIRDDERAIPILEQIVEVDAENLEALEELEEVYERREDYERLAETLERKARLLADNHQRVGALKEAAELYGDELEGTERAIEAWEKVLREAPTDEQAIDRLADLYLAEDRLEDLRDLYADRDYHERLYGRLEEAAGQRGDEGRATVYEMMAGVAERHLEDRNRLVHSLESLLEATDEPGEVADHLAELYRESGDLERESEMLQIVLEETADEERRVEVLARLSTLAEQNEQFGAALNWQLEVLEAAPDRDGALERAETLAGRADDYATFVELAERIAEDLDDEDLQADFWRRLARVEADDLERPEDAIAHEEKVAAHAPKDLEALEKLADLYDETGDVDLLVETLDELYEIQREEGAEREDLVDVLARRAEAQWKHLDDREEAWETYEEILELEPDFLPAIRGVKTLHRRNEEWTEVLDCLQRELGLLGTSEDERRLEVQFEIAEVYRHHRDDAGEALYYYREILDVEPDHEEAIAAVEAIRDASEKAREAAVMLEPIFRETNRSEKLAETLEARLTVATDDYEKEEIFEELTRLYRNSLADPEGAFEYGSRQFQLDPERREVWRKLEELAGQLDRFDELESLFADEAPETAEEATEARREILRRVARFRRDRLDDPEGAVGALERLYDWEPGDHEVAEQLEQLYRQLERREDLLEILEDRVRMAKSDEARVDFLREAAALCDEILEDDNRTAELYRQILEIEPGEEDAVAALESLYRDSERWFDLEDLYVDQLEHTFDPSRRQNIQLDLARLRTETLEDWTGAEQILSDLLAEAPGDPEVVEAFEQLDDALVDSGEQHGELRRRIAEALEPVYRDEQQWEELIEVLGVRLDHLEDRFDRVALLDELANLYMGRLGDSASGFEMLERAVVLDPEDEERRDRFETLGHRLERVERVVEVLRRAADRADAFVSGPLYRRIGELSSRQLDDAEGAIEAYRRVLERDEADMEALRALEELYVEVGEVEKLVENLRAQTRYAEPKRRAELWERVGEIERDRLERPGRAIEAFRELLSVEPESAVALEHLEELYEAGEDWIDLVDILEQRAELTTDVDEQVATLTKLAVVYEEKLHDPKEAIATYEQIMRRDGANADAMAALERLYEETDRWADLADLLRDRLVHLEDGDDDRRTDIELKLAEVFREELYEVDEAIELYRSVREREPTHERVVEAFESLIEEPTHAERVASDLVEYYRETGAWEDLVELYETRKTQLPDPHDRANLEYRISRVLRQRLDEMGRGLESLADAWRQAPDEETYERELVGLLEKREDWGGLAEVYRDVLPEVRDRDHQIELHTELAELEREKLDDPLAAEEHYREVIALDDGYEEAYEELDALLTDEQRWHDLVDLLEAKRELYEGRDPERTRETLSREALLQREVIQDGYAAAETYERVLELEPTDENALEALTDLYREQERWADLAEHLRRRLEGAEEPETTIEWSFELAEILREELYRHEEALDLYAQIVDLEVDHAPTRDALEVLFDEEPSVEAQVAPLLDRIYRYRDAWGRLLDVLEAQAELSDDPDERRSYLEEGREVAEERLDDAERAFDFAGDLVAEWPERDEVRREAERLAVQTGAVDRLTMLYDDALQQAVEEGPEFRATLLVEQGELYESYLESPEEARRVYGEALLEVDGFEEAIDALERLLMRQEDAQGLSTFYRERAQSTAELDRAKEWLQKLARHEELVRFDLDAAINAYYEILEADPSDEHALSAARRLLAYDSRWHDLADLLVDQIDLAADEDERVMLKFRLAQIREGELDDIDRALELYREILDEVPGHRDTLRALEGLLRDLADREGSWRDYRLMIINELRDRYGRSEEWRRIVDLLEEKRDLIEGDAPRAEALREEADLIVDCADDAVEQVPALSKLAEAYCLNPSDRELWEQFRELAAKLDVWARVPKVLLPPLSDSDDPAKQAAVLRGLGDVYRDEIGDQYSAVTAYQAAVDRADDEEALESLESVLADLELWEPLVDVLEKREERIFDPDARTEILARLGEVYDDKLEMPHEASPYYEELRAEEPEEGDYYERLASIYERTGQYQELEELLRSWLEFLEADQQRIEVLRRLATIQDEYLDRGERAIETYRELHDHNPDDEGVVGALARLYEQTGRWPELLGILEEQRDFAESLEDVNYIEYRRGEIHRQKLGNPVEALEAFETVLERDVSFEPARDAIVELTSEPATATRASEFLQQLYRADEQWEKLQQMFEDQLEVVGDPDRRGELYMELAQLHEEELGNKQMAFAMLGRAFRELPDKVYIRHELDRLSGRLNNPDELLAMYEDALETGVQDPDLVRDLHFKAAEIAADAIGDLERGIEHARQVLVVDEFDLEALELLDRLYQQNNHWENLAEILERRLEIAADEELNDIRFRLGYLYEVMFEDNDTALAYYREVLADMPEHPPAIEALERLVEEPHLRHEIAELLEPSYREKHDYERLVQLWQLQLEIIEDDFERADLNRRIAEVQIDKIGDHQIGFASLGRALRADPHSEEIQERLEGLVAELERFDEMVALYEDLLDELTDPVRVVELAEKAAEWAFQRLDDVERATQLYERVLEVEPDREAALEGLEAVARRAGRDEELADVLERRADIVFDADEQRAILLELAGVATDLEDYQRAADAYQQALLLDEGDTEVMRQLVGLYEVTDQYEELVDVLDRLRTHVDDVGELVQLNMELARYCQHFLDEPDRAVGAYRQVLEHDPDHLSALERLEALYCEQERWDELQSILRQSLELAEARDDEHEIARLAVELGSVAYEQFGDIDPAIEWFDRALEIQSGHPDVLEALEEIYRQEEQWDELMELFDDQLAEAEDDETRADLVCEMGRINLEYLDDPATAEEYLSRAAELDPENEKVLEMRARLCREREAWTELLEVFAARLDRAATLEDELALKRERAELYERDLDQPEDAIRDYRAILEVHPLDVDILGRLHELYEATGNLHGKYGLLEHEAEQVGDEQRRIELYREMAELADGKLGAAELAVEATEQIYELRPDDLDVAESLVDTYLEAGRIDDAQPIIEELVESLKQHGDREAAARFQHRRGKLAEQNGDLEAAEEAYQAVFELDDSHIPNLLSLGKLHYKRDEVEEAKEKFQKLLLHQMKLESDEQKVDVYYHLGKIRLELGDDRRAKDMFNRALSIDGNHEPSKQALQEL
jgi:tetratricopeptide (TPR) repeat protein